MMVKEILNKKGVKYSKLSISEKVEVTNQLPNLVNDNSIDEYLFYYSNDFKCWIVTNAMEVPMRNKTMKGVTYG